MGLLAMHRFIIPTIFSIQTTIECMPLLCIFSIQTPSAWPSGPVCDSESASGDQGGPPVWSSGGVALSSRCSQASKPYKASKIASPSAFSFACRSMEVYVVSVLAFAAHVPDVRPVHSRQSPPLV